MSAPNSPSGKSDPNDMAVMAPLPDDREWWERLDREPPVAWAAFTTYRDLGTRRTLLAAYRQETGIKEAKQASGSWNQWAAKWRWSERVKAYDAYLDRIAREQRESAHKAELTSFRDRSRRLAAASGEASISLLTILNARLKTLEKAAKEKPEEIKFSMLPSMLRAAAFVGKVAGDAEANALAIDELLERLEDPDERDSPEVDQE